MDFLDLEKNTDAFNHFWYRARRKLIDNIFRRYNLDGNLILEVGCGAGSQLEELSKYGRVVGCDINHQALAAAEKRGFSVFYQDIGQEIKVDCQYDVVCAFDVLEHIKDDRQALANIYKLLKPGGLFIFTVPAFPALFSAHDIYLQHQRRYSRRGLKRLLAAGGLKVYSLYYWNFILFPFIAGRRLITRKSLPKSDAKRLPQPLNLFLYRLLICENKLIGWRVKFPFGLSLVGVAKKAAV